VPSARSTSSPDEPALCHILETVRGRAASLLPISIETEDGLPEGIGFDCEFWGCADCAAEDRLLEPEDQTVMMEVVGDKPWSSQYRAAFILAGPRASYPALGKHPAPSQPR
jgi:hypothetical protein